MKRVNLVTLFLLITCTICLGDQWNIINEKTWMSNEEFPTSQYVFYETDTGLKKAIFQINGSGLCATLSVIYDVEIIGNTINLKNELKLDNSAFEIREITKTHSVLIIKNESMILPNDSFLEYNKVYDEAIICNWLESFCCGNVIPIKKLKSIPIGVNQIYYNNDINFGPNPDNCGIDNNPVLTEIEANFMNDYLKNSAKDKNFNFLNTKIVFATGNNGTELGSKIAYFDNLREFKEKYNGKIRTSLIVLNEKEKLNYGYDAIVTYWVKFLAPKANKILLEKTKVKKGKK